MTKRNQEFLALAKNIKALAEGCQQDKDRAVLYPVIIELLYGIIVCMARK